MPLLRSKFITKHSTKLEKTNTDNTDSQLSDGQTVAVESVAPDDIALISLPPRAVTSTKDSVKRDSNSRSLLEKYRKRSSSSSGSLDLDSGPIIDQRYPASLLSNSTSLPREVNSEPESAMDSKRSSEKPGSVNTSGPNHASEPPASRTTRSHSRHQSRSDSHDYSEVTSETSNTAYKVTKNDESDMDESRYAEAPLNMLDVPRSLVIRKKGDSHSPSPRSPLDNHIPQLPPRSPARTDTPEFPSPQSPIQAPRPLKTLILATPRNSSAPQAQVQPPRGASMKERLAFVKAKAPSPPLEDEQKKVAVRPPFFDPNKGLCQWTSPHTSTSRPDQVWEWPKRWTCCRCEATTIVEQKVCSNVSCSHYRCPNDCRMIRVPRPLGQFVGFGVSR